jgi:Two component regulator propeller
VVQSWWHRPAARSLSVPRLGLALAVLVGAGWLTSLPYLLVRLGLPAPIELTRIDGPHAFLGLVAGGLIVLKVAEVAAHRVQLTAWRLPPWQRWLSRSLAFAYTGVLASGLALVAPWPAPVRTQLVNLHLLLAAWALVATIPHVAVHLKWRLPELRFDRRFNAAVLLIALAAISLAALPIALSPLAAVGSGAQWSAVGPRGHWMFRLLQLSDGRLLAAGDGVFVSSDGGRTWTSETGAGQGLVFALATGPGGSPLYLGTANGLLTAPGPDGPYTTLSVPSLPVTAVYPDPDGTLWIGGHGAWRSEDGGAHWLPAVQGMTERGTIWVLGRQGGLLMAGGTTGVYRQDGAGWRRSLDLNQVISLDAGGVLGGTWASSMGGGLAVLRDGRWTRSDAGMAAHGGTAIHVTGFTALGGGRALATLMHGGLDESLDGGRSWYQLSPGFDPGAVWAALPVGSRILVASDSGLHLYKLPPAAPAPSLAWWLAAFLLALAVTGGSALLGLVEPSSAVPARVPAAA